MGHALDAILKMGSLKWTRSNEEAIETFIKAWVSSRISNPNESTLILAHSNREVRALNELARLYRKEAGELVGKEYRYETAYGTLYAGCGDRIEFRKKDTELKVNNGTEGILVNASKEHKLKIDVLINELMQKVKIIESEKYIHDAKIRVDLGTPPGKAKSLGDAINWLALLDNETIPEKEDLFFITKDSDFISKITSSEFNSFLLKELEREKKFKY